MNFRQWFLPTEENDYTPHFLQKAAIVAMFLMVLLSFATVNLQALLWQSSQWLVGTVLPAVVVDLTNNERQELQAAPLVRNALLDEAARLKAKHMAENSYFAHYSPDGVSPWYWFEKVSYTYAHAGENLAIHFKDSGAVINAWMDSPAHRANIINTNYTEIGVGTAKGFFDGYETVFVVQLFGTPALTPIAKTNVPIIEPSIVPELEVASTAIQVATLEEVADIEAVELVAGVESSEILPVLPTALPEVQLIEGLPSPQVENFDVPKVEEIKEENLAINEVLSEGEQTSIYSTHFATSSGLKPFLGTLSTVSGKEASVIGAIATRPSILLQSIYLTLGFFVIFLLFSSIILGVKNERPLQVVYGVGLLILMSGLFYVHTNLITSVAVAADFTEVETFGT